MMKTIQMTIDNSLLSDMDEAVRELGTNRSAFIRDAVQLAIKQLAIQKLEAQHIAGYTLKPQTEDEIDEWQEIQAWGDE